MNGFEAPNLVYLVLLLVMVGSSLLAMRLPLGKAVKMALGWVAIFGVAFVLFAFRDNFSMLGQRLRAEATGTPIDAGGELRIPKSPDGHFWVEGSINGRDVRLLVDSGASITTIGRETAAAAGITPGYRIPVNTANGTIDMWRASADRFSLGPIEREGMTVHVNQSDDVNVLGMNFLSSLRSWRVEGNYLVLAG